MKTVEPIKDIEKLEKLKHLVLGINLKHFVYIKIGLNTGLRCSDILGLKWNELEKNNFQFYKNLKEKKTGKTKSIKFNGSLKKYLKKLRRENPNDYWVFQSNSNRNKGEHWSRFTPYKFLKKYSDIIGLKNIGTHSLRKTFGYHNYNKGVDLSYLQKIFNHSTPRQTLDYIGITQEEIDDIYINTDL